jgi:ABC-type nickel/cobalt efflux system permease component RcnA
MVTTILSVVVFSFGTFIVGAVVAAAIALAIWQTIRDKKRKRCGGNCGSCMVEKDCHKD